MQTTSGCLILFGLSLGAAALIGCASSHSISAAALPAKEPFGQTEDGKFVDLYTLRNSNGAEARICTYGGIVVSLKMPDRNGHYGDVVLGYDNLSGYLNKSPYFGALIGRYGNRIGKARFTLNGKEYRLSPNDGVNSLHGGTKGFDKVVWDARPLATADGPAVELRHLSHDGEEGYPGNLWVKAVYTLTEKNELRLEFTATTDKDTIINLTHHSYFNLAGKGDVLGHVVMIPANKFTPVNSNLIPTGEMESVEGTPFDFQTPTAIGARISQDNPQLKFARGYDQNWVISKPAGKIGLMARVSEPSSGRVMEVFSSEPGLQFYTGNFLDGTITGKGGWVYEFRNAFCMEPQHFPDSPNQPNFPFVVLKPGQTYHNTIIYKFSVQKMINGETLPES